MKTGVILLFHLIVTVAKLLGPGGTRGLLAEMLLLKHQLMVINRPRQRAPNLTTWDRFLLGFASLFVRPGRLGKIAVVISTATLFKFHEALKKRKYSRLFSAQQDVDGPALCRMFNQAVAGTGLPKHLSSDNDPLFLFLQWKTNRRILEVTEIKTVPHIPMSHSFV